MRTARESQLKKVVMRFLHDTYPAAMVRKRHGTVYAVAGDPDIYFLLGGVHVECELKRPGEEPTILQTYRLREWRNAGARTAVIHSLAEMKAFMDTEFP